MLYGIFSLFVTFSTAHGRKEEVIERDERVKVIERDERVISFLVIIVAVICCC